jgi:hypothetical protein
VVVRSPRSAALPARYCRRSLVRAGGRESGRRNRDRTTSGRVIRPQPTHEVSTRSLSACAERLALTRETVKSAFATRSGQELTTFLPRPTNSGRPQRRSRQRPRSRGKRHAFGSIGPESRSDAHTRDNLMLRDRRYREIHVRGTQTERPDGASKRTGSGNCCRLVGTRFRQEYKGRQQRLPFLLGKLRLRKRTRVRTKSANGSQGPP